MAKTRSLMSVAVEVPEIVTAPALFLVTLLDTVVAGFLSLRSGTDKVREIVLVPVTVLVPVPETVVAETDRAVGDGQDA